MAFRYECTVALGWDEMQKARTEVLAELSSKTVEQIEQDTKDAFEACSSAKVMRSTSTK